MTSPYSSVHVFNPMQPQKQFSMTSDEAFALAQCAVCTSTQMVVVGYTASLKWLRCVACGSAHAQNGEVVSPGKSPLSTPEGLHNDELAVWNEVRACLGVAAYTAAVMLCRKMLFHLAVTNGLPEKNERGRAPSFAQAVARLESVGIVTIRMRPWVDRIKDIGNDANHELRAVTQKEALDVGRFTEQLLRLSFEMDALVKAGEAAPAVEDVERSEDDAALGM